MGVNAAFAGRSYPAIRPYVVGREKIREFADAVGATDEAHRDVEAARARGYADVIAPPTMAVLIAQMCDAQLMTDPEAGIDYGRLVHGEMRFVHHRPITAGDEVTGVLHVDSVKEVAGNAMVTTRSELTTLAGEALCTATSLVVIRAAD